MEAYTLPYVKQIARGKLLCNTGSSAQCSVTTQMGGGWRCGRRFKREEIGVHLWLIHVVVWQKLTQPCKAIIFQLKIIILKRLNLLTSLYGFQQDLPQISRCSGPISSYRKSGFPQIWSYIIGLQDFPSCSVVKNPPAMQETQVRFLGQEDPMEEDMATHSSILAWRIPWTEEPGRLQSMGLQRVRTTKATQHTCIAL